MECIYFSLFFVSNVEELFFRTKMSLFLMERIKEQKEDPANDEIVFTCPWVIQLPPPAPIDENDDNIFDEKKFATTFGVESVKWRISFLQDKITVHSNNDYGFRVYHVWNGTCFISYDLFYDNDMRFLYHSSIRTKMSAVQNQDIFETPNGYMTKILEAITKKIVRRIVIFVELHLPAKYFYRPFEKPASGLSGTFCNEYPEDLKSDYRFGFLKKSDFAIKCPDGSIPCRRIVLNITSRLLRKCFSETNATELAVEHTIDVVEPIIRFFHSRCFRMPKLYDLNFADRLLEAVIFFQPEINDIELSIHQSLCHKFVTEIHGFDTILGWMSIASKHSLYRLEEMIVTTIVSKYYFKFHQLFPENARNLENAMFRHVFRSENRSLRIFKTIDKMFMRSCMTNVILE